MTTTLAELGGAINLVFRAPEGEVEVNACHLLCRRVFQSLSSPSIPLPTTTSYRLVLGAFAGDKIVGTGRIECTSAIDSGWWQISSVATDAHYRGRYHIASTILRRLEAFAGGHGCRRVTLTASRQSGTFYENRGYVLKYPNTKSRAMYKDL